MLLHLLSLPCLQQNCHVTSTYANEVLCYMLGMKGAILKHDLKEQGRMPFYYMKGGGILL